MTLAQRLVEAEAALHDLSTSKAVAEVRDANGELVRFHKPQRSDLVAYITELKRQLGQEGTAVGPMRIWG